MEIKHRHRWVEKFLKELEAASFVWRELEAPRGKDLFRGLYLGRVSPDREKSILFFHGFGNDAIFPQLGLFRSLLNAGWNILTCDLPGHGRGGTEEFNPDDFQVIASDLFDSFDRMTGGLKKIHLAGYSIGGGVALSFAHRHPHKVKSLIMISTPLELSRKLPIFSELMSIARPSFISAANDYGAIGVLPAFAAFKRQQYPIRMPDKYSGRYVELARAGISQLKLPICLKEIIVPTLFISGSRDYLGPCAPVRLIATQNKNIEVREVAGENHYTTLLSKKTSEEILKFLAKQPI